MVDDRSRWNERYRGENAPRSVNENLIRYAPLLKRGRVLDLAGGMGQNAQWLVNHASGEWRAVVTDISDEGVAHAPPTLPRVLADALALPFSPPTFDTILCVRFFDERVNFSEWLRAGGTVFFETYARGDEKYRPDFNPAHRFDPKAVTQVFHELEILVSQVTDDGTRVYATVVARKRN